MKQTASCKSGYLNHIHYGTLREAISSEREKMDIREQLLRVFIHLEGKEAGAQLFVEGGKASYTQRTVTQMASMAGWVRAPPLQLIGSISPGGVPLMKRGQGRKWVRLPAGQVERARSW